MRRPHATMPRATAGLLAAAMTAACGIASTGPRTVPNNQVPFGLLQKHVPTTTTTAPTKPQVQVTVYFVNAMATSLVPESRFVTNPAPLMSVLNALVAGPAAKEAAGGVQSAIGTEVRVLGASTSNGVATVNFNAAFGQITGPEEALAVAQVVFTVAGQLGASVGVSFEIAGAPISVPDDTGAERAGPVHVQQYLSLAPSSNSPTTPTTS